MSVYAVFCNKYDCGIFLPGIISSLSSSDMSVLYVISNYIKIEPMVSVTKYSDRLMKVTDPLPTRVCFTYVAQTKSTDELQSRLLKSL
jgi:hypothetical protein